MEVYNQEKTQTITEYDLTKGYLKQDYIEVNLPEVQEVKEQGHYETLKEYENGGKDVKWIIDVKGVKYQPARTENIEIYVYIPYTIEELQNIKLSNIRRKREEECFAYINRGMLWYNKLTEEQKQELESWYQAWLDVPQTYQKVHPVKLSDIIPSKPKWLK